MRTPPPPHDQLGTLEEPRKLAGEERCVSLCHLRRRRTSHQTYVPPKPDETTGVRLSGEGGKSSVRNALIFNQEPIRKQALPGPQIRTEVVRLFGVSHI